MATKPASIGLQSSLVKLAEKLVRQANEDGVSLDTRLDVLKVAGTFCVAITKAKVRDEDSETDKTFESFKDRINNLDNGKIGHG